MAKKRINQNKELQSYVIGLVLAMGIFQILMAEQFV
jgi:hypothetical protein